MTQVQHSLQFSIFLVSFVQLNLDDVFQSNVLWEMETSHLYSKQKETGRVFIFSYVIHFRGKNIVK